MQPYVIPDPDRFWSKVRTSDGCWIWTGTRQTSGYGAMAISHEGTIYRRRAHRVSWELVNGPIPPGLLVCHRCDNKLCVRPDHLFLGTPTDNVRDCWAKGRHPVRVGQELPWAKLDVEAVAQIRSNDNGESNKQIASRLGISPNHVSRVRHGRAWNHTMSEGGQ